MQQPGDLQALHGQKHTCYVEQFRIRGGEVGPDQVASASTIVGLLQETGGNHSVMLVRPRGGGGGGVQC